MLNACCFHFLDWNFWKRTTFVASERCCKLNLNCLLYLYTISYYLHVVRSAQNLKADIFDRIYFLSRIPAVIAFAAIRNSNRELPIWKVKWSRYYAGNSLGPSFKPAMEHCPDRLYRTRLRVFPGIEMLSRLNATGVHPKRARSLYSYIMFGANLIQSAILLNSPRSNSRCLMQIRI